MKRFTMETTTSVNNMRSHFNEVLTHLDKFGYNNFLKNNVFKNKLISTTYGTLLADWYNPDETVPAVFDTVIAVDNLPYRGTKEASNLYKFYDDGSFAIKNTKKIAQLLTITDAERLANDGRFNLTLFMLKGETFDSADINLYYWDGAAWQLITELDNISETISDTYADTYYDVDGATSDILYTQTTKVYDLSDSATYNSTTAFKVVIENAEVHAWTILCDMKAYFGNMDAASFVKNMENDESIFTYDTTAGDYYYSSDGQDKIYLSSGKYLITVGTHGQYATIKEAIDSIDLDGHSGDSRIIYLTSDITLDQDTTFSNTLGYNITIMGNGYSITCDAAKVFGIIGGSVGTEVKNITMDNVKFIIASDAISTIPIVIQYAENITFRNCYADGNFLVTNLMTLDNVIKSNINFTEFKDYGAGATKTGKGITVTNSANSNVNIQSLVLNGGTTYSPTDLIGVYVDSDSCVGVTTTIQNFNETV